MSAWVVERNHIEYLVGEIINPQNETINYAEYLLDTKDPSKIGQELWNENYRSVNYRYNQNDEAPAFRYLGKCYEHDPLQVLKSIACLEYQSCEHPQWKESKACELLRYLKGCITSKLSEGKEWGAPEPIKKAVRLSSFVKVY